MLFQYQNLNIYLDQLTYKKRKWRYRGYKLFKYISFLKKNWKLHIKRKNKKLMNFWKYRIRSNNLGVTKKNKAFWFFQKILLYWMNLLKYKKRANITYYNYINNTVIFFKNIYKKLLLLNIKFFIFLNLKQWYINLNSILYFLSTNIFFLNSYMFIFLFIINNTNILYKKKQPDIVKWLKKKRKRWVLYLKNRRRLLLLKQRKKKKYIGIIN